jgi:ATP-binding cassette subfamily B protein
MFEKIVWLARYYKGYTYMLLVFLILTPIQAAIQVTVPLMIGYTGDYLKNDGVVPDAWLAQLLARVAGWLDVAPVTMYGLTFIFIGLMAGVLYAFVQTHRAWMNLKLEWLFRQNAFNGMTDKGPNFFTRFRTGDLVTRLTDDVAEKLSWFACSGIFRLYEAACQIVFVVFMMISIDPMLTLWTAGPLPILIIVFFRSSATLDRRYDHLQSRISKFNDVMEACFSGIRVVKAYVREKAQRGTFSDAAEDRRRAEISAVKITTIVDSMYQYVWQFGIVIVLLAGGYKVVHSELSVGSLAVFIYYVVWLVFPMFDVGQFLVKSRQSGVSIDRLMQLEQVPSMVADTGEPGRDGSINGDIRFVDVDFGFPGSERKILRQLSLEINAGETVAVVGKVGTGKSWLVNMIPRLVDPSGGRIEIDGVDLRRFSLADLRRQIGYVPQEPVLFSDSVRSNILFGRESIDEKLLDWAIEVAQLREDLAEFPSGLDTAIGTRGMSISGGQKQRLALARALVGKPKILILDDCTSALDSRTESRLWDRLHEVMPEMTAILITHRPDTLEKSDRIYVLDAGQVIESGTHAELMAAGGLYARIYKRYQLEEEVGEQT